MTTEDFIIELFCRVDDVMMDIPKHVQAELHPSEVGTLALLFAIKGVGNRAFYRWLERDFTHLFPQLPERTRLFRLFVTHREWAARFLAAPSVLGVIDAYGIELIHPLREGRTTHQIGRQGLSNHRWIVGGKLCLLVNKLGLVVDWECATANVHDTQFQPLVKQFEEQMIGLSPHTCKRGHGAKSLEISAFCVMRKSPLSRVSRHYKAQNRAVMSDNLAKATSFHFC